jgi:hypothetical protein
MSPYRCCRDLDPPGVELVLQQSDRAEFGIAAEDRADDFRLAVGDDELVPQAGVIALLVDPNNASAERRIRDLQEAARAKGAQLPVLKASTESEIDAAFASLAQLQAGALVVEPNPFFVTRREQIVAWHRAMPFRRFMHGTKPPRPVA